MKRSQGVASQQRDVACQDQHVAGKPPQRGPCLHHGVPGAELPGLLHAHDTFIQACAYAVSVMTRNDDGPFRFEAGNRIEDVVKHRLACHRVQDFGHGRAHALAFTGGQYDGGERPPRRLLGFSDCHQMPPSDSRLRTDPRRESTLSNRRYPER